MQVAPFFFVVFAALSSGNVTAADPDIARLGWLAGCWKSETAEAGSGEHWLPLAGGTMLGVSRTVKHGKTVEFEFMELRGLADGSVVFIAHPSGQGATTFPLLQISESEAIFEKQQHDFPQRVAYAKNGAAKLLARIEGTSGGKLSVIEFPMARVSCETQQ